MEISSSAEINSLILSVREHDDAAFAELVIRYTPMLNKVISGFYSSNVRVDEAFSEACVGLYRAALSYDFDKNDITFGLYARLCVYRCMCDLYGKAHSAKYAFFDDLNIENLPVSNVIESSIVGKEIV